MTTPMRVIDDELKAAIDAMGERLAKGSKGWRFLRSEVKEATDHVKAGMFFDRNGTETEVRVLVGVGRATPDDDVQEMVRDTVAQLEDSLHYRAFFATSRAARKGRAKLTRWMAEWTAVEHGLARVWATQGGEPPPKLGAYFDSIKARSN